ncbi:C1 family peptidase [Jiulongibacter sediminis]|uniref:Peptidase C1A papain C-terminal domain-containing protein n=1 Tax=Jiulongibacter sediminis TaxID=1605367 RepID=A0A0P7BP13_9BACT|nr:C1 family peptidase [Jiulongibacter sediminis]KPM47018.1 hypothetical protein AFM12_17475 [Jiulongibacter sediminis]TBX22360.1 hypothetical protein TK44_17480 [Jiulongibacter sediminis]
MNKLIFFLLLSLPLFSQGLNLDDSVAYDLKAKKQLYLKLETAALPASVDLSMYVPSVIDQGEHSTCVGISTTYYMRTIMKAIDLNLTDRAEIDKLRFSPSFTYNAIKDSLDIDCQFGTFLTDAFDFMKKNGAADYNLLPYPSCASTALIETGEDSKILDYTTLFTLIQNNQDKVNITKKALAERSPVVAAIVTTSSLSSPGFFKKLWFSILQLFNISLSDEYRYSLWQPEKSKKLLGGHAICIVGYDDQKFGGAFHAVNSYGPDFGDEGFFWIRYSDFLKHAKYGYQAFVKPDSKPGEIEMSGEFYFEYMMSQQKDSLNFELNNSIQTQASEAKDSLVQYFLPNQETQTNYRVQVRTGNQVYIYLLTKSEKSGIVQKLYPETLTDQPPIGPESLFQLPNDESFLQLRPPFGQEYICILFSPIQIPRISWLIEDMNAMNGSFPQQLQAVFGDLLVPRDQVQYLKHKMGFELKGDHEGQVVPLLISFSQVERKPLF